MIVRCHIVLILHDKGLRARVAQLMWLELGHEICSTLADLHDFIQVHLLSGSESADDLLHWEDHVHPQLRIDGVIHDTDETRGQCPTCQQTSYLC